MHTMIRTSGLCATSTILVLDFLVIMARVDSYYKGGGRGETHAFLLQANTLFQSQRSNIGDLGSLDRQSTVSQEGIGNGGVPERAIDGETVGIYKWGSTTWTDEQEDPFLAGQDSA